MQLRKGKENIGLFKGIPLFLDWDYLLKEYGLRREFELFDRSLGLFLTVISAITLLILFFTDLQEGKILLFEILNPDRIKDVLAVFSVLPFLYALFLRRNRTRFIDSLRIKQLSDLRASLNKGDLPKQIELSSFIDHDLLNVIDDLLRMDDHNFLPLLMHELYSFPKVMAAAKRLGLNQEMLQKISSTHSKMNNTHVDEWLVKVLKESFELAYELHTNSVDELAFFLFLLKEPLKQELKSVNVLPEEVASLGLWIQNKSDIARYKKLFKQKRALKPVSTVNRAFTSRFSPILVQFQRDYTAEVAQGDFSYSLAREEELEQMISYLVEGEDSAVILTGNPGVGRTTLVKSLAVRMVVEDVPKSLKDMRLVGFDFSRAFALSQNIEKFKERVQSVFEESAAAKNIILVLDDFEQILSGRRDVTEEVVGLIINALDRYKIRTIAVATTSGYERRVKPERSLSAKFKQVELKVPSESVSQQILMDVLPKLEDKFKVKVSFDALVRLIKLSGSFSFEKVMPDKGIDLLEEVMVEAQSRGINFADEQLIEEVVSAKVGVKVGAISTEESKLLVNLEEEINKRIVGQEEAVIAVADALRRSRAGLMSGKRPIASFLFFGPTGVGKTELAKALTKVYYGDEKLMLRLDMSEYQEAENLDRLLGKEVKGTFQGGYLTEAVRTKPYSLLLLDEIEKANAKVLDLFLQVLDEGSLTDGAGRKVDFSNTIIIATSNLGSKEIADYTAKGYDYQKLRTEIMPRLRNYLRIEFINRFDKVVLFKPLVPIEVQQIAALMLKELEEKLEEKGITFSYAPTLLAELAKKGYNPLYGARELRRVIQDDIENHIAKQIVGGTLSAGGEIHISSLANVPK